MSTAVGQAGACAPVTHRARVRSPVGTSFLAAVFWGFSSPVRHMSGSFRPPRSPNIIWPSLSSIIIHYGRQWPEMFTRPKASNIQIREHHHIQHSSFSGFLSASSLPLWGILSWTKLQIPRVHCRPARHCTCYPPTASTYVGLITEFGCYMSRHVPTCTCKVTPDTGVDNLLNVLRTVQYIDFLLVPLTSLDYFLWGYMRRLLHETLVVDCGCSGCCTTRYWWSLGGGFLWPKKLGNMHASMTWRT